MSNKQSRKSTMATCHEISDSDSGQDLFGNSSPVQMSDGENTDSDATYDCNKDSQKTIEISDSEENVNHVNKSDKSIVKLSRSNIVHDISDSDNDDYNDKRNSKNSLFTKKHSRYTPPDSDSEGDNDNKACQRNTVKLDKGKGKHLHSKSKKQSTVNTFSVSDRSNQDNKVTLSSKPPGKNKQHYNSPKKHNTVHTFSDSDSDGYTNSVHRNKDKGKSPQIPSPVKGKPNLQSTSSKLKSTVHAFSDSDSDDTNICKNISKVSPRNKSQIQKQDTVGIGEPQKRKLDADNRTPCRYGKACYRKNPSHFKDFSHPGDGSSGSPAKKLRLDQEADSSLKTGEGIINGGGPLQFYMTKVHGIHDSHNARLALDIKDILDQSMGNIQRSCQFNYMIDIPWLVQQYPREFRDKPLLIVHGFQRADKAALDLEASAYDNIRLCQAKLEIMYGTHHTKMMFLEYDNGLRVVIHTSNLIKQDWFQKSQGVWVSPLFPKLGTDANDSGDSPTNFKRDLIEYLSAYKARAVEDWIKILKQYDMSKACVFVIGSIPGRHTGVLKHTYGHLKLRKVLEKYGPDPSLVRTWPVIGQFSSIGSLGANKDNWVCGEWYTSLSSAKGSGTALGGTTNKLQLVFPSKDNVRVSLEGYPAGCSLPYSINVAKKQVWLNDFFHQWKSEYRGRSRASPHIKTYMRVSPDAKKMAWFLVTSANLSKAAWGALEKNRSQLMIRSYEIGVLFLPQKFNSKHDHFVPSDSVPMYDDENDGPLNFPQPFDLPLTPYSKMDAPWIYDIPYVDKPDSNGNKWCPT